MLSLSLSLSSSVSLSLSHRVPLEAILGNLGVAYKNMKTRPSIGEAMSHHGPLKVVRTSIVSKNKLLKPQQKGKQSKMMVKTESFGLFFHVGPLVCAIRRSDFQLYKHTIVTDTK